MADVKADFIQKAQKYMVKGQWRKALDQYERAHAVDNSDPVVTLRMGDLYVKLDDSFNAADSYVKTASMFASMGETPKALATYKMALKIDPEFTGVQESIDRLVEAQGSSSDPAKVTQSIEISNTARGKADITYDIPSFKSGAPVNQLHETPDRILSSVNLTTAVFRESTDNPADVLYGDNVDFIVIPEEDDTTPVVQNSTLLSELSEEELRDLMESMKLRTFQESSYVVREGEEGHSLFIIRKGKVRVVTRINDQEVVLARLGEGDFFGEVSFLTGRPRTADIIADETSDIMELCRDDLNEVISKHPIIEGVLRLFHENRVSDTVASIRAVSKDFLR